VHSSCGGRSASQKGGEAVREGGDKKRNIERLSRKKKQQPLVDKTVDTESDIWTLWICGLYGLYGLRRYSQAQLPFTAVSSFCFYLREAPVNQPQLE
jgi:hypothetical protein